MDVGGHSYRRLFSYVQDGIHHEATAPGGAAALRALLQGGPGPDLGRYRTQYQTLVVQSADRDRLRFTLGEPAGVRDGLTLDPPSDGSSPVVVWDEGWGGLDAPAAEAILWASPTALPERDLFARVAARACVFLPADVLRAAGALITRQVSWERTATQLVWQLQNNAAIDYLLAAPHVVIALAEDGLVHLARGRAARLVLADGRAEGTRRAEAPGRVDDAFLVMTAKLAQQLPSVITDDWSPRLRPLLDAAGALLRVGYVPDTGGGDVVVDPAVMGPDVVVDPAVMRDAGDAADDPFAIPSGPARDDWCAIRDVDNPKVFDMAYDYVTSGAAAIAGLPQLRIGALTTVDRWEIESYQNVRNLILDYTARPSQRPLCIAVFGAPGSGKSFGVSEIARNVLPGRVQKLEFNVSQFTGPADLAAAFQGVRDVVLAGKVPLVFFDEFDSDDHGRRLGWLKSFLMPMQDGRFKDDVGEHPLGQCILVFAGGTASSLAEFTAPGTSEDPTVRAAFRDVKGPDFVSRLKGTIDVLGPNPAGEADTNYVLRRALLLRSLAERKLKLGPSTPAPISPEVVWAMLLVPKYSHGARSMETIMDMSRIDGAWTPAALPSESQLALHVDAGAFLRLILRPVILNGSVEDLARAIHDDYRRKLRDRGQLPKVYNLDWDDLPRDIQDANRAQAAAIADKLASEHYAYDAGDTPFASVHEFDAATLQRLARREHERWMAERLSAGWTYAPQRDDAAKHHPLLVAWDDLDDDEKQKDVDAVANIIPLLESVGLRVYKTL